MDKERYARLDFAVYFRVFCFFMDDKMIMLSEGYSNADPVAVANGVNDFGIVTKKRGAAGNRCGIRADQCLFLEAAFQRRRCDRIEARLAMLESRN